MCPTFSLISKFKLWRTKSVEGEYFNETFLNLIKPLDGQSSGICFKICASESKAPSSGRREYSTHRSTDVI